MTATAPPGLVGVLVDFGRALRAEGVSVGSGDMLTFCAAMTPLDPTDLVDLYWGGRVSLVTRRDDIVVYDRVFREFFLDAGNPVDELVKIEAQAEPEAETVLEIPAADPGAEEPDEETVLGLMASNVETLKSKSFAACTDDELDALRRIMARIKLTPPRRRTRRTRPARQGRRPDLRATIRRSLRMHGEMVDLYWRRRRYRLRPLILILDISGSMSDYSRALLQFAYSAKRASSGPFKVEVFCFGTRLTHLTTSLETRKPDDALERAAGLVVDWEGGTRIGDSLDTFVRHWGRRGMARGGVVVICSDGLDRGDPDVLATAMERLSRLCHRIVWMNPHKGTDANYRPQTVGMMVAGPHIDVLLSGHDLSSLEELADLLPELG
ncbi:vWA domain-containing protein [Pseudonocardia sp. H11422]|uniref:vWA domain-containing protein n=1 Tax=Pseudonocardia sp. H11422 TaxID=2835866 RepID=UPI001BDCF82A|nr:VWA domain-containing protein [Pseudonocardia sp. H11422]